MNSLLGERDLFPFPKSVYAVRDCLEVAVGNRPNAVVLDFFGGSGTTLHATCMLNAEDGGSRRSIIVTNNEVNPKLTKKLNKAGLFRGQPEFEARGIFEAATKPRCKAAITGTRPDGKPADGNYLNGRAVAEGYGENVEFFRLDYLNPDSVELGKSFAALHPLLWLAAGARGKRKAKLPVKPAFFLPDTGYAVLFDVANLPEFTAELVGRGDISQVYVVTDSQEAFAEAREKVGHGRVVSMLYRTYLRFFRANTTSV